MWFADSNGDQPDVLTDFASPLIPTGNANESEPAVFLGQQIVSGNPYHSSHLRALLDYDRNTQASLPLQRGQWSLVDIYPRTTTQAQVVRTTNRYEFIFRNGQHIPHQPFDPSVPSSSLCCLRVLRVLALCALLLPL